MALPPIHPGEHLLEELGELGMSAVQLAQQIQVPGKCLTEVLEGRESITGDLALRLAHFFGTSPEFWLNLQKLYELRLAEEAVGTLVETLPTLKSLEAAGMDYS